MSGIQLFRESLSDKSVKVNGTLLKVVIGNDGFALDCLKPKVFRRKRRKQHRHVYSYILFLSN